MRAIGSIISITLIVGGTIMGKTIASSQTISHRLEHPYHRVNRGLNVEGLMHHRALGFPTHERSIESHGARDQIREGVGRNKLTQNQARRLHTRGRKMKSPGARNRRPQAGGMRDLIRGGMGRSTLRPDRARRLPARERSMHLRMARGQMANRAKLTLRERARLHRSLNRTTGSTYRENPRRAKPN